MIAAARMTAFALAGATLFAACGGGGGARPPVPDPGRGAGAPASVRFSLTVPAAASAAAGARRQRTISPLTQSVSIAVNGAAPLVFGATATSPGCTPGAGGRSCTFSVPAPVGSDTFTVQTYSGPNATGSVLNTATLTSTVAVNQVNAIVLTLNAAVNTLADSGPGSLRQAVLDAAPGDTLAFAVSGTITLASPIALAKNLTLAGPGSAAPVTISGGGATQLFTIPAGVNVTISGLTLANGKTAADGAAIANAGMLTLGNDTLSGNSAGGCGGAIFSAAGSALSVTGSTFTNNATTTGGTSAVGQANDGGALCTFGTSLAIASSTFTGNATAPATSQGLGGALYSWAATLTVDGSTFANNSARAAGAMLLTSPSSTAPMTATITNSSFTGNAATGEDSGAIENAGNASSMTTISNTTFTANTAATDSGAIENDSPLTLTNVTFTRNSATGIPNTPPATGFRGGDSGAMEQDAILVASNVTFDSNSANADGGAMEQDTTAIFTNVTFTNNHAHQEGGAVENDATLQITGGTFTGNSSDTYGGAYVEFGSIGALANVTMDGNTAVHQGGGMVIDSESYLNGVTISHNTVTGTGTYDAGGGIFNLNSGGRFPGLVVNATISGNSAPHGGGIANGGLLQQTGTVTPPAFIQHTALLSLAFVTIADNRATASDGNGPNVYNVPSTAGALAFARMPHARHEGHAKLRRVASDSRAVAAIAPATPQPLPTATTVAVNTLQFFGSIVGHTSPAPSRADLDIGTGSAVLSQGYNIVQSYALESETSLFTSLSSDLVNVDPRLGPLQNNGGPTLTQGLLAGSPAIGAIPAAACTASPVDQRGTPRPLASGGCDIGAVQQ